MCSRPSILEHTSEAHLKNLGFSVCLALVCVTVVCEYFTSSASTSDFTVSWNRHNPDTSFRVNDQLLSNSFNSTCRHQLCIQRCVRQLGISCLRCSTLCTASECCSSVYLEESASLVIHCRKWSLGRLCSLLQKYDHLCQTSYGEDPSFRTTLPLGGNEFSEYILPWIFPQVRDSCCLIFDHNKWRRFHLATE